MTLLANFVRRSFSSIDLASMSANRTTPESLRRQTLPASEPENVSAPEMRDSGPDSTVVLKHPEVGGTPSSRPPSLSSAAPPSSFLAPSVAPSPSSLPSPPSSSSPPRTSSFPAAADASGPNKVLAIVEVRGQRFSIEQASRGRYDVRSLEAHARVGTITFSGGYMQLTAEKILMITMVEVARVALHIGAL
jgi:hypothetical protein